MGALLQSVAFRFVWEIILIVGGGAFLAYLKKKWPEYAAIVLYGLVASVCVAVLLFTITGSALLSKEQPITTPENIEENVKAWAYDFGLGVQKIPDAESYFRLNITYKTGRQIAIFRSKEKEHEHYLQFETIIGPSLENQVLISKLSKEQSKKLIDAIFLELTRAKISHRLLDPSAPVFRGVILGESNAITSGLNQQVFSGYLDDMQFAMELVQETDLLAVNRDAK